MDVIGWVSLNCLHGERKKWIYVRGLFLPSKPPYTFPSLQKINKEKHHNISPSKQKLHRLRFLQKLGCQKTCWDQVRLSSLLNKQVGPDLVQDIMFNRPRVAGAVLQLPLTRIHSLGRSVILFLQTFKISLHPNRKS